MTLDKSQLSSMSPRQKATVGIVFIVIAVVIWQVVGMFGGSKTPPRQATTLPKQASGTASSATSTTGTPNGAPVPQPKPLADQSVSSQQLNEMAKLQQETQNKYVVALNELQVLKLTQQIAETNKQIAAAKLDTVKSQKDIVDLLTKPAAPIETTASFTQGYVPTPGGALSIQPAIPGGGAPLTPPNPNMMQQGAAVAPATASSSTTGSSTEQGNINYVVISVSQLLNKWSAVLGYQGKLYSVFIGDVLPPDQSTVVSIDKYSVILEKEGVQRKVSLVPII